ncbi:MAG: hypothetical protein AAF224_01270 [Pseudomonadota bacterium]
MLRQLSPAIGRLDLTPRTPRPSTVIKTVSTERRSAVARVAIAAACGIALSTGASADSLAQPKDRSLEHQAAAYVQFREDVAAIQAEPISSAESTRDAHRRLSAHNSNDLSAGWVAYAALLAADTQEFADGLKKQVQSRKRRHGLKGRDGLIAELSANPRFASELPGADEAVARVLAMAVQDGKRVVSLGESFKTQAYAMQKTAWGKARIQSSSARITEAEEFAKNRPTPFAPAMPGAADRGVTAPSLASLNGSWSPEWGAAEGEGEVSEPNAQVIMDRVLILAARYAIGATNEKLVAAYARNDRSSRCLHMSTLTLKQCIAATRTPYEEAFCLGEHGLNDVAGCLGWVAGPETTKTADAR